MDERETKDDFILFVPRRLTLTDVASVKPAAAVEPVGASQEVESAQSATPLDPTTGLPSLETSAAAQKEIPDATETSAPLPVADERQQPAAQDVRSPTVCNHESAIRTQAIRLAIVACGRALRHVALVHPELVARYIDDAIATAGSQGPANVGSVRVGHPLEIGEVRIVCDGSEIRADLAARAELLVRAVADADA